MFGSRIVIGAALALALGAAAPSSIAAEKTDAAAQASQCDRSCLYGFLDKFIKALSKHDTSLMPVASTVRYSEDSVELALGDGMWNTVDKVGKYDLRMADPKTGNVGWYGVVYEHGQPAAIAARIKVQDGLITEIETVLARRVGDGPFPNPDPEALKTKPIMNRIEPADTRLSRDGLIAVADGYFDTLQQNNGTLHTKLDPDCNRIENGVQTTNNPKARPGERLFELTCEQQFKTGNYLYDDRIRARRFMVDEERGLVMAGGFIDHTGRLTEVTWTDGTVRKTSYRSPHSYVLFELFKIVDGKVRQVEAVFTTVPYNMPSPWFHPHPDHE